MKFITILIFLILVGCTSNVVHCSPEDRRGMYSMEYNIVEDGCGFGSFDQVSLIGDPTISVECTDTYTDWSDNNCSLVRSYTCSYPGLALTFNDMQLSFPIENDLVYTVDFEGVTDQITSNGDQLGGWLSISIRDDHWNSCMSLFDVKGIRN